MEKGKMSLETIPIDKIDIGERFRKDYNNINELAADIRLNGLISPVAVIKRGDRYELAAGGRRMKALAVNKCTEIPCRVYNGDENEYDLRCIELAENVHRENLTWQEEAELKLKINEMQIARLGEKTSYNEKGWTKTKTAELLGESSSNVFRDIELAEAMKVIPQLNEAKTKDDAYKMLKKIVKTAIRADNAKVVEAKIAAMPAGAKKLNLINSYVLGDFFVWADTQKEGIADVVEIDPPYGIDLDSIKKSDNSGLLKVTSDYNEVHSAEYEEFVTKTLSQAYRLLKDDGWLILWFAPEPWFSLMYNLAIAQGFKGNRIPAVWTKTVGQTNAPNYYMASAWEPFFYFRKGNPTLYKQGRTNVFEYPGVHPMAKVHPTERPIELMTDVLSVFAAPGSSIVVPFAGSGNTILAASNINCTAVGCDLSKVYRDAFVERVDKGEPGFYASYMQGGGER